MHKTIWSFLAKEAIQHTTCGCCCLVHNVLNVDKKKSIFSVIRWMLGIFQKNADSSHEFSVSGVTCVIEIKKDNSFKYFFKIGQVLFSHERRHFPFEVVHLTFLQYPYPKKLITCKRA